MAITDKLNETYNSTKPVVTTLSAQKAQGATSLTIQDATGWPTDTAIHFILFKLKPDGVTKDEATQTEWKGTLSGTTISNLTLTAGTDILYPTGSKIAVAPTAKWAQELIEAVQSVIGQTGGLAANTVGTSQIQNNAVTSAKIDSTVTSAISPTGSIVQYGGSSAPTGWLLCDGSAVNRTTYAALFAVVGTTYGSGDGSTTFNVPNFKGRVAVGRDSGQTEFDVLGETGGAKTHTLSTAEMPSHTHSVDPPATATDSQGHHTHQVEAQWGSSGGSWGLTEASGKSSNGQLDTYGAGAHTHTVNIGAFASASAGSGSAHNNLQPYITVNYIIKS
jgi:microcystin-dependent protein